MRQLFGDDFMTPEERELGLVQAVEQPEAPEAPPEWMTLEREFGEGLENRARRLTLWLEDRGIDMSKVLVVAADGRLAVVTGRDVKVGEVLFEIPDDALITATAACADPDVRSKCCCCSPDPACEPADSLSRSPLQVGRALRDMSKKLQPGKDGGFDTFAIAAMLAAERARRAPVRGVLRRQDGGVLGGGQVLPQWAVEQRGMLQGNMAFSPFITSLNWPEEDECFVDSAATAEATMQGVPASASYGHAQPPSCGLRANTTSVGSTLIHSSWQAHRSLQV